MLKKLVGIGLIVVGAAVGLPVLWPLVLVALMLAWYALKVAAMVAVVYVGYRLYKQRSLSMA